MYMYVSLYVSLFFPSTILGWIKILIYVNVQKLVISLHLLSVIADARYFAAIRKIHLVSIFD